jgi:hypothetical protein
MVGSFAEVSSDLRNFLLRQGVTACEGTRYHVIFSHHAAKFYFKSAEFSRIRAPLCWASAPYRALMKHSLKVVLSATTESIRDRQKPVRTSFSGSLLDRSG